jgi:hypothetical protein
LKDAEAEAGADADAEAEAVAEADAEAEAAGKRSGVQIKTSLTLLWWTAMDSASGC